MTRGLADTYGAGRFAAPALAETAAAKAQPPADAGAGRFATPALAETAAAKGQPNAAQPAAPAAPAAAPQAPEQQKPIDPKAPVKVDTWRKGPNDSIEGALRQRGYSLNEIYTKDKSGRTLADRVLADNRLRDHKRIPDGTELKLPFKPGFVPEGSASTQGLQPGQSRLSPKVETPDGQQSVQARTANDGQKKSSTIDSTAPGVQSQAHVEGDTRTRIDTSVGRNQQGNPTSLTTANNSDGSATQTVRTTSEPDKVVTQVEPGRGAGPSTAVIDPAAPVSVTTPGNPGTGDLTARVGNPDDFKTGPLERFGNWVVGGPRVESTGLPEDGKVAGVRNLRVEEGPHRARTVTGTDSQGREFRQSREGDGYVARFGRWMDGMFGLR